MNNQDLYQVTQEYRILPPQSGHAYPILRDEWQILKKKIKEFSMESSFYHAFGWCMLSASLSTFISIVRYHAASVRETDVAWAIVATTLIAGVLSLFFSHKERAMIKARASDIIVYMDIIEKRYECNSSD